MNLKFLKSEEIAMSHIPRIEDVMTPSPTVIEIDRSVSEALSAMEECGIRHLPVTAGKRLVGIISDRDLRVAQTVQSNAASVLRVGDICTTDAYVVAADRPLHEVVTEMARGHFGCVVVVSSGEPIGIFTTVDACREFGDHLRSTALSAAD